MAGSWDSHLDQEQAERYSMGALSEQEEAHCEEHLLVCETCRRQVLASDQYVASMKTASASAEWQARRESRPGWLVIKPVWALAAAIIIAATVFLFRSAPAAPPFALELSAMRGTQPGAVAPAGRELSIHADLSGLPQAGNYRLELLDAGGRSLWSGPYLATGVIARGQHEGYYLVRLTNTRGELLREYGLQLVKTPAASGAPR